MKIPLFIKFSYSVENINQLWKWEENENNVRVLAIFNIYISYKLLNLRKSPKYIDTYTYLHIWFCIERNRICVCIHTYQNYFFIPLYSSKILLPLSVLCCYLERMQHFKRHPSILPCRVVGNLGVPSSM